MSIIIIIIIIALRGVVNENVKIGKISKGRGVEKRIEMSQFQFLNFENLAELCPSLFICFLSHHP